MSFLTFNLAYYKKKIEYYERNILSKSDIYEAKQLLKLIDDLIDEGYYSLFDALQKDFNGVDRLRNVISSAGEKPFENILSTKEVENFKNSEIELSEYIENLIIKSKSVPLLLNNDFLKEAKRFSDSIPYDKNSAYVFLLRDTLLPYICFRIKHSENLFPWLLSRSFLDSIYKNENVDDIIRASIFNALENGCNDFQSFICYCKKEILHSLEAYPKVVSTLKALLSNIKSEKIIVVETGCYGTFPLLLSALDERVTFKMYTTVPYLFQIYKNNLYTKAYENLRRFETLSCCDKLFKIADFRNNNFYVSENQSKEILEKSLNEISFFLEI